MITSKVVLILGRFGGGHLAVLHALRDELRIKGLIPVVFDFSVPSDRDTSETVSLLAHMATFIIADLTNPSSIPQEIQRIVPLLPSVPVVPILQEGHHPWSMWRDLQRYPWVLKQVDYKDTNDLLANLAERIVDPALSAKEANRPK